MLARLTLCAAVLAAWIWAFVPIEAPGQTTPAALISETDASRADGQQRAPRRPAAGASGYAPLRSAGSSSLQWLPYEPDETRPVRHAAYVEADAAAGPAPMAAPEVIPAPEAISSEPAPDRGPMFAPQISAVPESDPPPEAYGPAGQFAAPRDGCGQCGSCQEPCGPCGACGPCGGCVGSCLIDLLRGCSLFAGVHGFKGPVDLGQNGNFGFHEGLNYGGPLGDPWGLGYQLGVEAAQSNFSGFLITPTGLAPVSGPDARSQVFFTGGLFHRKPMGGFQSGVVFDYMHDNYYQNSDLKQIRSETAFVFDGGFSELGYFGAYGISKQRIQLVRNDPTSAITFQPNDVFAVFYRRHFTLGGQGRLWAGGTGAGQGIVGGEATVPLGTNWALENNFVYAIPKTSASNGGQREETWSATISLVWYPGRAARGVFKDPFQPLFGVGDNSAFLVRRGSP
jgi:hypothetical protein